MDGVVFVGGAGLGVALLARVLDMGGADFKVDAHGFAVGVGGGGFETHLE